ncbi:MAG: hypothetical protein FJW40_27015 [Acidobacteria bacterium]|nr:hypothetical protein [Acidobacteriota bacterium]
MIGSMLIASLVFVLALDSGTVLRTLVGYNTSKASLPLSEEQRKEADRLAAEAQKAGLAGNLGEAMRLLYRGMAVMNGAAWTPPLEFAASLEAKADHQVVRPGQTVSLSWSQIYSGSTAEKLSGQVVLASEGTPAAVVTLAAKLTVDAASLGRVAVAIPAGTAAGNYWLEARLTNADGTAEAKARAAYLKRVPVRVGADVAAEASRLRARLGKAASKHPVAEYAVELYAKADSGEVSPHRYDFEREFERAHAVLDAVEKGGDPFGGVRGDVRMAYRSGVDDTLQPYRLFVPAEYDGKRARPLVVALHGMGGDENSMFDQYRAGVIKTEGEKRGWFIVCPKGREPASMYRGKAETDVLDVVAEVRRMYKIDASRIYLMGHSMGGFGTWSIAMNRPALFAALGPFAGGGNPGGMEKIRHVPQYVVHGDNDKTVPVTQSRGMVEAAKKLGVRVVYVEVPGGGHSDVVVPQFGAMFDFFSEQAGAGEAGGQ